MVKKIKCPHCSKSISENVEFCPFCSHRLINDIEASSTVSNNPLAETTFVESTENIVQSSGIDNSYEKADSMDSENAQIDNAVPDDTEVLDEEEYDIDYEFTNRINSEIQKMKVQSAEHEEINQSEPMVINPITASTLAQKEHLSSPPHDHIIPVQPEQNKLDDSLSPRTPTIQESKSVEHNNTDSTINSTIAININQDGYYDDRIPEVLEKIQNDNYAHLIYKIILAILGVFGFIAFLVWYL